MEIAILPLAVYVSGSAIGCVLTEPGTRVVCASMVSMNVTPVASVAPRAFDIVTVYSIFSAAAGEALGSAFPSPSSPISTAAFVAVTLGTNGSGAGAGRGAFAAVTFIVVAAGDDVPRPVRDCRSRTPLAAATGTKGIIKIENESRHAINTLRSRLVILSENRTFIGISWVRVRTLFVEVSIDFLLAREMREYEVDSTRELQGTGES
jgi:hypothetical protein